MVMAIYHCQMSVKNYCQVIVRKNYFVFANCDKVSTFHDQISFVYVQTHGKINTLQNIHNLQLSILYSFSADFLTSGPK